MKFALPKLCLVLASAALVLAGCAKKPARPDPGATVLGPQSGGPNVASQTPGYTPPTDTTFNTGAPIGLIGRDSAFDAAGQDRSTLQAQTVYFDFDQSTIKASEREKLKAAKEYLDKNPAHRLLLEGHCDWRGTAEYNLGLGDRRANAAKKYLQTLGVPADRLETLSKGSLEAAKNADDATRAKDRRVAVIVVNPAAAAPAGFPGGLQANPSAPQRLPGAL